MTGIPSVPTDNLYKFIATVGVIILLISIAVPLLKTIPNNEIKDRLRMELIEETNLLVSQEIFYDTLKSRWERSTTSDDGLVYYDFNEEVTDSIGNKFDTTYRAGSIGLFERYLTQTRYMDSLSRKKAETVRKYNSIVLIDAVYRRLSLIGTLIGIFLMAFGFYYWYNKVQIYLDMRGRIEAGYEETKGSITEENKLKLRPIPYLLLVFVLVVIFALINKIYVHRHEGYIDPQGAKIVDARDDKYDNPFPNKK